MPAHFEAIVSRYLKSLSTEERFKLDEDEKDYVRWLRFRAKKDSRFNTVADDVDRCSPDDPCASPACPLCACAYQDALARTLWRVSKSQADRVLTVTVAPSISAVSRDDLTAFDSVNHFRRLKECLRGIPFDWGLFVTDYSYNEHTGDRYGPFFLPHWHGVLVGADCHQVRDRLRAVFRPTDPVPRPVRVEPWDGDRRWLSYLADSNFRRRIGFDDAVRFDPRTGEQRVCRGTRYDRLRSAERGELALHLHDIGFGGRLAAVRCQVRSGPKGLRIVTL